MKKAAKKAPKKTKERWLLVTNKQRGIRYGYCDGEGYGDGEGDGFFSYQSLAGAATAYWFGSYTAIA